MISSVVEDRVILEAFNRALAREAHNLSRWPELLWQQLFNRLQWDGDSVDRLRGARNRRSRPGATPWVRLDTRLREPGALIRTLAGRADLGRSCAFSPDGRRIVSGCTDGTVRLWDVESGAELRTLAGHSDPVFACVFSPDERWIVSASSDVTLKVWDAETGAAVHTLRHTFGEVRSCAFSPDGDLIVSAAGDKTLKVWETESGICLLTLEGHAGGVNACAFSPDGRRIVSASHDGTLKEWDAESGAALRTLEDRNGQEVGVTHAPDGHVIVSSGGVNACAFSPDGRRIVSARHTSLIVWDAESGAELRTLVGHTYGEVQSCAFSPDGRRIVSAGDDGTLKEWDAESGAELRSLSGHTGGVAACAFSPDGRRIVSAGDTLKIWDADPADEVDTLGGHADSVEACAFSPDGRRIVSASEDGTLKVWDAESGAEIRTLETQTGPRTAGAILTSTRAVLDCAFSPDGRRLVSAGADGSLKVWDSEGEAEVGTVKVPAGIRACAFSPDGRRLVSAIENVVIVWDLAGGREPTVRAGDLHSVATCAFSPDGRRIVFGGNDRPPTMEDVDRRGSVTLKVWDAESEDAVQALEGAADWVRACGFSPDGRWIVSVGGEYGALKLWDAESGTEIRTLGGGADPQDGGGAGSQDAIAVWRERRHRGDSVRDFAFSPDGRWIVTANDSGIRVWDAESGGMAMLPLRGAADSVAAHPWLPRAVCGDSGGAVYRMELVGIEYGPIIVTPVDRGDGPTFHCPKCWREHQLDQDWPGQMVDCPTPTCDLTLRVNPFIASDLTS